MKRFIIFTAIAIFTIGLASSAMAADWLIFALQQKENTAWYYDKNSIDYTKDKKIIGISLFKDKGYMKMWVKATAPSGEKLYLVDLSCAERTAAVQDNNGKSIYNLPQIDYLYEKPVPPDTVFDSLIKATCR